MKLLLDQGLPRSAAAVLLSDGHDAIHAGDAGLAAASDVQILVAARDQQRTVVTLDADFHAILAKTAAVSLGHLDSNRRIASRSIGGTT